MVGHSTSRMNNLDANFQLIQMNVQALTHFSHRLTEWLRSSL